MRVPKRPIVKLAYCLGLILLCLLGAVALYLLLFLFVLFAGVGTH